MAGTSSRQRLAAFVVNRVTEEERHHGARCGGNPGRRDRRIAEIAERRRRLAHLVLEPDDGEGAAGSVGFALLEIALLYAGHPEFDLDWAL